MKSGAERGLEEYSALTRRGYASLVSNSGKITAMIVALVTVLLTFTDITLTGSAAASFGPTLITLLLSSYVIYFSLEDAGEQLGHEGEDFAAAMERYRAAEARIEPQMIGRLRQFCHRYSADEVEFRRRAYLASHGCTEEEYASFLAGDYAGKSKRILAGAAKIRPLTLTPAMLMTPCKARVRSGLSSPTRERALSGLLHLLPSTLCMIFTVSVMLTAKEELSAEVIIGGIMKLSALPVIGFKGYAAGYSHVRDTEIGYVSEKTRLLEEFLSGEQLADNTE